MPQTALLIDKPEFPITDSLSVSAPSRLHPPAAHIEDFGSDVSGMDTGSAGNFQFIAGS